MVKTEYGEFKKIFRYVHPSPINMQMESDMSEKLVWDSKMSVGNKDIDDQHKHILLLFQQAVKSLDNPNSFRHEFHIFINEIVDLVRKHFEEEEIILEKNHSPTLYDHKEEHEKFRERLTKILYDAMQRKLDKDGLESLLSDWLNHIIQADIPNKKYMQD